MSKLEKAPIPVVSEEKMTPSDIQESYKRSEAQKPEDTSLDFLDVKTEPVPARLREQVKTVVETQGEIGVDTVQETQEGIDLQDERIIDISETDPTKTMDIRYITKGLRKSVETEEELAAAQERLSKQMDIILKGLMRITQGKSREERKKIMRMSLLISGEGRPGLSDDMHKVALEKIEKALDMQDSGESPDDRPWKKDLEKAA